MNPIHCFTYDQAERLVEAGYTVQIAGLVISPQTWRHHR